MKIILVQCGVSQATALRPQTLFVRIGHSQTLDPGGHRRESFL